MIEYKVQQQRLIVLIALYILRQNNYTYPTKRQVLNLVRMRNLMNVPVGEAVKRDEDDHDAIWENDLCFKRKDLLMDGLIGDEQHGRWSITNAGIRHIEERSFKWLKLEDTKHRETIAANLHYMSENLFDWMLKIARGEDLNLRADARQRQAS